MTTDFYDTRRLLLDLEQVASALSIGRTLTSKLVYSGELPSLTLGRRRLVALDDLTAYIDGRKLADGSLGRR